MANSDEIDLMSVGQHCSIKTCNRLDFLPFQCNKCLQIFCLDHRQEKDHNCLNSEMGNSKVPECPLCGRPVRVSRGHGEDVETQVERHIASGCRDHVVFELSPNSSSSSSSVRKKTRCTHKGCKRKDLVPYTCPQCERVVCIRHRQPMDHPCHPPPSIPVH